MQDHRQCLSRKDGYRLIYLVSRVEERVAFLDIYPKRGPLQQLDILDEEYDYWLFTLRKAKMTFGRNM